MALPVFLDPSLGEAPQPLRLRRSDGRHRVLEGPRRSGRPAGLDLTDDESVAVPGDDVDLTGTAGAPVALQDRHSGLGQPPRGEFLAVPAQCSTLCVAPRSTSCAVFCVACVHVGTTSGANDASS